MNEPEKTNEEKLAELAERVPEDLELIQCDPEEWLSEPGWDDGP